MKASTPTGRHLAIAGTMLALESRRLTRDGTEIPLRPKSMDLLVFLAGQPRRLASKQAILDKVWPRIVVTNDSITQCIIEIRRALGDTDHSIVRTVPKRGYVLDVDVREVARAQTSCATREAALDAPVARSMNKVLPIALCAVALITAALALVVQRTGDRATSPSVAPATPNVAVLPFEDLSHDGSFSFLADGIAHEITHALAREPAIRVIGATSARALSETGPDRARAAAELGVSHIVSGGIQVAGKQLRVTAQLVDVRTSQVVWSQATDRTLDDAMVVKIEIAAALTDKLVTSTQLRGSDDTVLSWEPDAYIAFLKGQFYFSRRADGDVRRARAAFSEATVLGPNHARAWAGLAGALWVQIAQDLMPNEPGITEFRHAAERALALDPQLAEAHIRMANYWYANARWEQAESHLAKAQTIDPGNVLLLTVLAGNAALTGDIRQGISLQERAAQRDPLSAVVRENLAHYYFAAGELEKARIELRELLSLEPTRGPSASAVLAEIAVLQGRFDDAAELMRAGSVEPVSRTNAIVLWSTGEREAADAVLEQLVLAVDGDPLAMIDIAKVYAQRQDTDAALRWLDDSIARLELSSAYSMVNCYAVFQTHHSPLLATLASEPRWRASMERMVALRGWGADQTAIADRGALSSQHQEQ